ncbi:MAG: sensor histidine kinase [Wenzhouxiangella sp.]
MHSLRTRLILQILLPLTLLAAFVVWTTFQAVEGLVERRLEKEIELVARAIRMPVQQAYAEGDLHRVSQSLNAVFEIGRVYGAYVYDDGGRRVVVAGEARPGTRAQIQAAELVELGQELGEYAELAGEEVYSYFVPLTGATGRIIGLLQVVRQESDIAGQLARIRERGWWVWAAVVGLMVLVVLFGHRQAVSRHVRTLLASMSRVEAGDRDHRAPVRGPSELVALGRGLNRMLDAIAEMEARIEQQRREHLHMTERLREQKNLAALGRFSSGVAHELGAPLTVIDGDARRLLQQGDFDQEAMRRLTRMRTQIQRTRQLIRQLMDFVRDDQQAPVRVSVERLLDRVGGSVAPERETRGIVLEVIQPSSDLAISGHEIRLEHALLNLVRNAIQAASAKVRVSAERLGEGTVIRVEDDGPGVDEALGEDIFEPFQTRRHDGQGTGLGLAIVRSVVEEHDAVIAVDRSPSLGGARFTLSFGAAP